VVCRAAAEALGKLGEQESTPAFREALKDKHSRVRFVAAKALGKLGDRESIPALREALKDKDWGVRYSAAEALVRLGAYPQSVSQVIELLAGQDLAALEVLWPEAKPRLLAGLRSANEFGWAAYALLWLGHEETIPALIDALDRHGTVQIAQWYFNCGNAALEAAARRWAEARGLTVPAVSGPPEVRWGEH